jgi:hypothetical protein
MRYIGWPILPLFFDATKNFAGSFLLTSWSLSEIQTSGDFLDLVPRVLRGGFLLKS